MIYSASKQKAYCRCCRYFYHHYIQGYRIISKPKWLDYGTHIDDLLAIYDTQGFDAMMEQVPLKFTDKYTQIDVKYLLIHYHNKFKKDLLPPVDIEGRPGNQFHFQLPLNPKHIVDCDIEYQGYLDKVAEHKGWVTVIERKTTKDAIEYRSVYWDGLESDKQNVGYSWGLSETIEGTVNKVIYEVLRKPNPSSKGMAAFKKTKIVKKEAITIELPEYEDKVKEFFETTKITMVARRNLWIPQQNRDEWSHDLVGDDDSIKNMTLNQSSYEQQGIDGRYAWPRNQGACKDFGGCQFNPVCQGQTEISSLDTVYKNK